MNASRLLDDKMKCVIEAILSKGGRVELIPVKDGVKIIHIKREIVIIHDGAVVRVVKRA